MFTIPNFITLLNLMCGCMAIFLALQGHLFEAFLMVAAAAVFDFLDGFAARLLNAYSPLGKQLDSLADVVSFGVAPSMVLYAMLLKTGQMNGFCCDGNLGFAVFVLAAFSALRLARFNIDESQTDEFRGLPTPACALLVASAGYSYEIGVYDFQPWMIFAATAVLCYLLVSPVRMFSFKFHSWGLKENGLRYGFLLCSLIAIAAYGGAAIPVVVAGYVVVSIIRNLVCSKSRQSDV